MSNINKADKLKIFLAKRWLDPVKRIEDIFNVRRGDGTLVPLKVPKPQQKILRDGILGRGKKAMDNGRIIRRVINKGRQLGFSIISAAEAILIAMDYPDTRQYYVATRAEQAVDWLTKLEQLVEDSNNYPKDMGGGKIVKADNIKPVMKKVINGCLIVGFSANPSGMRGPTGVNVILDEFAWMILFKNQQQETLTACKHFLSQGGQQTILSTPRTLTDYFMDIFINNEKHSAIAYYCPVILNWQELDLNQPLYIELDNNKRKYLQLPILEDNKIEEIVRKYRKMPKFEVNLRNRCIKQKANIPYSWKSLAELENDRKADLELFKQENLGIAIDERFKVLKGEWIYNNLVEGDELSHRGDSFNPFVFGIDIAKQRDLFVITVFEKVDNHWFMRYGEILPQGQNYTISAQRVNQLFLDFLPIAIRVDNTGGGIPFCDILDRMECGKALQRVDFTQSTKTNMAENIRLIAKDNRLHMLNNNSIHSTIIQHLLKVERQILENSIKYTGKGVDKEGRDDGFWCYKKGAEVLTSQGWKYIENVKIGEKIPSLNIDTKEVEFTEVKTVIDKNYNGKMIKFKNYHIDLIVTPNHKILCHKSKGANKYYPLILVEASKIKNKHFRMKRNCVWKGVKKHKWTIPVFTNNINYIKKEKQLPINNFLKFLGYYISEGNSDKNNNRIYLAQEKTGKARKGMKNCLEELKLNYTEAIKGFNIYDKQLVNEIKRIVPGYSFEKRIPRIILNLDKTHLIHLFNGLMEGDGHKKGNVYYTSSKGLADDFQEMLVKLGYAGTLKVYNRIGRKALNGFSRHKEYIISISTDLRKKNTLMPRFNHHKNFGGKGVEIDYKGNIVCLELKKNHTMLIRNNGRVVWSGNSTALAVCENPARDKKQQAAMVKASLRSVNARISSMQKAKENKESDYSILQEEILTNVPPIPKEQVEEDYAKALENIQKKKEFNELYKQLDKGLLPCPKVNKGVKPLFCVGCEKKDCAEWTYHHKFCAKYDIDKKDFKRFIDGKQTT